MMREHFLGTSAANLVHFVSMKYNNKSRGISHLAHPKSAGLQQVPRMPQHGACEILAALHHMVHTWALPVVTIPTSMSTCRLMASTMNLFELLIHLVGSTKASSKQNIANKISASLSYSK